MGDNRQRANPHRDKPLKSDSPQLLPGFGFRFEDLYDRDGLDRLDQRFLEFIGNADPGLVQRLIGAREETGPIERKAESQLLIEVAEHLDDFLAQLFAIEGKVNALSAEHDALAPLYKCKRQFVQRKAVTKHKAPEAETFDGPQLRAALVEMMGEPFSELSFAHHALQWLEDPETFSTQLDTSQRYAAWAVHAEAGCKHHAAGVLFKVPHKLDFQKLVPVETNRDGAMTSHRLSHMRRRNGFALTDQGTDLVGALDQANYCIWCHEQGKDSCSHGLKDKTGAFKDTVFGVQLAGCPLEERISEFQKLKSNGTAIGALAMICVDNPMVAATGHRICNDCMKSCIYQKQDPVNIPEVETRTLKDVLALPWGFEIYSLLTRWNPLDLARPVPRAATGKRVLIAGMGPAGFTVAHHLLNDGHTVVGVDGLKIEPLPPTLCGVDVYGERVAFEPVRDFSSLIEPLDERVMAGFGGVAEYGITVRWDKNFLKVIRLLLERRNRFALFGGVRFGGTLDATQAFDNGFDHIVLATGAGRPTVLDIPNALARGVRTASDFLMALQLTGAAKADSIANMQVRLPVVVIGGGLTAIDTATESAAYYPVQVEKFLSRYETLVAERGEEAVRANWDAEERDIGDEYLQHALAIRTERERAKKEDRPPRIAELLASWGGVTIAYRKRLIDSPSYTLNHEEVEKALEEGIRFVERVTPVSVEVNDFGHATALTVAAPAADDNGNATESRLTLPAGTILVAAGTQPNTVAAREDPDHFQLDGRYFQAVDENGAQVQPARTAKPGQVQVLLAKQHDGRFISFFGDLHPSFSGNVVKAMGGAKQGYPVVSKVLENVQSTFSGTDAAFFSKLNQTLRASVHEVIRLTPNIVEVVLLAPQAARRFQPGQFYRLQNFESLAPRADGTRLAMEGLALTGAWVDRDRGLVSTIVLEMGGSSDLCALLKPGEPVVLMGPTGTPTEITSGETVVLAGGGLGNAVLFSIGSALRKAGSRVLYFAGYKRMIDRYKVDEIEAAADVVVWCCDEKPGFEPRRPDDKAFVGNMVEAMRAYAQNELGRQPIDFGDCDRLIAIGSDRMMAAVASARHGVLSPYLPAHHFAIGSINSPMQCMMKEICAQCLQPQVDPQTGERSYVFSCFNQDQPLDKVDFGGLAARLRQNSLQEKLTGQWLDHCIKQIRARPSTTEH
ncbi:MAG TPA: FAD-dependent oxidoreductase [Burkholderiales bacterium]|nr:FAD-dependent oxidoreductase [Burkholderiales bacterium]